MSRWAAADPFNPAKTPTAKFPHPPGVTVTTSLGGRPKLVVDRDGDVFLACCAHHEAQGTASGWHPVSNIGVLLATYTAVDVDLTGDCGRS